jgi:radical SAM superfamily enzyme YgiQ (UPF0313 family)
MMNVFDKPNILLINFGLEALGIRQLSSFLRREGYNIDCLFLMHFKDERGNYLSAKRVASFVISRGYGIVGFSCMTGDYLEVRSITRSIKEISKNPPKIIWGGVHPTIMPEECLKNGNADIVFFAAAEKAFKELLSGRNLKEISNIAYCDSDRIVMNYSNVDLIDPNILPFPDFDFSRHYVMNDSEVKILNLNLFRELYPWNGTHYYCITSRGCPYSCAYCCNIYRGKYFRKSIDYFIDELKYIKSRLPFINTISIQDDSLFQNDSGWISDFAEKYGKEIGLPFRAALMPRFATDERLEALSRAGLSYVGIGLQGSSRLNREVYGRAETTESFLRAVHKCKNFGITARIDVIVDNPYEKKEDLLEIALALNNVQKPYPISVFSLKLFPGTRMTERAKLDGVSQLFSGDPYSPNLGRGIEKESVYLTPDYWRSLYMHYLPNLPSNVCRYLINNINKKGIQRKIISYQYMPAYVRKVGEILRSVSPRIFDNALRKFKKII